MLTAGRADRLRDAKVSHYGVPLGEQDVLRLDVTVHDAPSVSITQRVRHLTCELEGSPRR